MLFGIMFVFFIILSGDISWEICAAGAVVSAAATALAYGVLGWNRGKSKRILHLLPDIVSYCALLLWEIIKANIAVIRVILSPGLQGLEPQLFTLDSRLKTELTRTVLADSITITPGTFTAATEGERLLVHCLGDSFYIDNDMSLCFQRRLVSLEEREAVRHA